MNGDQKRGSRSLAIQFGKRAALRVAGLLFLAMIGLSFLPPALGKTGLAYLIPFSLMDAAVLFFTLRLLKSRTPEEGRAAMRGSYLSATAGLLAFLIARLIG